MNEKITLELPDDFRVTEVGLREGVLVSVNSASADVQFETVFRLFRRLDEPTLVTSSCYKVSTWTFSGHHMTGNDGRVEINLNKFLDCAKNEIRDVVVGQNGQPAVDGFIHSGYIGSLPRFIATPESEEPVFLTSLIGVTVLQPPPQQFFLPQALDVKVKVRTWKHDGIPAPKVTFSWIAIATIASVTNF